ncbi:MAG: hypothetical protein P4M12_08215 [Gammaproteobacteria bacterium]|nr:hypothetical protein [Gammaproteobacteria bacterium]
MEILNGKWRSSIKETLGLVFLFGIISALLLLPFASTTLIPFYTDMLNHIVLIMQAKSALAAGQFPLRTSVLNSLLQLPYPTYQFYSPTSYTIAALIDKWITNGNAFAALKLTLWSAFLISAMYMYALTRYIFHSKPAAIIAAVIYLCSPYAIFSLHYMHLFNETLAACLIPAVLYYTLKRFYHTQDSNYFIPMALTWYLLITIHIITFIYTSLFVGMLLLALTIKDKHHTKNLLSTGLTYVFSLMLAAWFLIPAYLLSNYFNIHSSLYISGMMKNAPSILTIMGLTHSTGTFPTIGWPLFISIGILLYTAIKKKLGTQHHELYWLPALSILFLIAIFLIWSPLNIWKFLPSQLLVIQMTLRIYSQAMWTGALLAAAAYLYVFKNQINLKAFVTIIFLIVLNAYTWIPKNQPTLSLNLFNQNPKQVFNQTSFLLDAHRNPNLINTIDSLHLHTLEDNHILQYNVKYTIPKNLLSLAYSPFVSLTGNFAESKGSPFELNALIDGKIIASKKISSGKFNWKIPLNTQMVQKNESGMSLTFNVSPLKHNKLNHGTPAILVDKIMMDGFLKPSEFLSLNKTLQDCHTENTLILCSINVPEKVKLLALPSYYYPQLIRIKLNGKLVPYQSILSDEAPVVGVIPESGKLNEFSIEFRGLAWANYLSWGAWICFIIMLAAYIRWPQKHKLASPQPLEETLIVRVRLLT